MATKRSLKLVSKSTNDDDQVPLKEVEVKYTLSDETPGDSVPPPSENLVPEEGEDKSVNIDVDIDAFNEALQNGGPISIPKDSIYMTTLMLPLAGKDEYQSAGGWFLMIYILALQYALYVGNIFAQLLFVIYIGGIASESQGECGSDPVLLWLTSLLFFTLIVRDIQESLNMIFWLYYFPRTHEWQDLRYSKTDSLKISSGMRLWYKIYCVFVIIVPKIVIISFLAKDGGRWLMSAKSNQDLILNCVALFFITDLDEIINKNLVPSSFTIVVEDMPDIDWPQGGARQLCSLFCGTIIPVAIVAGITAISYSVNCGFHSEELSNITDINTMFKDA